MDRWDLVGAIMLAYTAIVTPYEVAFLGLSQTMLEPRFIINRFIDVFFVLDMVVQLFVMYPEDPPVKKLNEKIDAQEKVGLVKAPANVVTC